MGLTSAQRAAVARLFLNGEQQIRLLVPKNRILADARFLEQFDQLGPDGAVALLILNLASGLEFHFECTSHNFEVLFG